MAKWTDGLSTRASNFLINQDCECVEDVLIRLEAGLINPNNANCRHYGKKSHKEVLDWLGYDYEEWRFKACFGNRETIKILLKKRGEKLNSFVCPHCFKPIPDIKP